MKHLLRKLHFGASHDDHMDAVTLSGGSLLDGEAIASADVQSPLIDSSSSISFSDPRSSNASTINGWLTSVGRQSPSISSGQVSSGSTVRARDAGFLGSNSGNNFVGARGGDMATGSNSVLGSAECLDGELDFQSLEEEYQVQLAMAISASNSEQTCDPEILEIEAVKRISLGLSPSTAMVQAEVIAYRYWTYNYLGFEDHIVDGFYDIYGITDSSLSERMPSLAELQALPVIDTISYEVVLVNRAVDEDLVTLEQQALKLASGCGCCKNDILKSGLVDKLAVLVAGHMGGPVASDIDMLSVWRTTSWTLKSTLHNIVLPLGKLRMGLARHRALLFKVLADSVGIPSRLVKGRHYTGVDEGAFNIIRGNDNREYIIDLVGDPGTLIPPDVPGAMSPERIWASSESPLKGFVVETPSPAASGRVFCLESLAEETNLSNYVPPYGAEKQSKGPEFLILGMAQVSASHPTTTHLEQPTSISSGLLMSQSDFMLKVEKPHFYNQGRLGEGELAWDEEAGLNMDLLPCQKKEFAGQQTTNVVKEKSHLAHKLHVVFGESDDNMRQDVCKVIKPVKGSMGELEPESQVTEEKLIRQNPDKGFGRRKPVDVLSSANSVSGWVMPNAEHNPFQLAARRTVAASLMTSLVTAASKSEFVPDSVERISKSSATDLVAMSVAPADKLSTNLMPNYDRLQADIMSLRVASGKRDGFDCHSQHKVESHIRCSQRGDGLSGEGTIEEEISPVVDYVLAQVNAMQNDVAEWEILWEDVVLGERIGLGSYGEVYRGDWNGSEVAVKKFLDQDLSGDALEEFRSEVQIMRRLRHPNVVLFMGAVTRAPNLSIVTEFLPRGSLYRIIHRPHNQLDERRRLRMAFDVAKGMNYLHSCTPLIVHRDLKSPNLLVDKNWVVKVCDFGLSRMKHNTFLSSKSTAGTPEWMAPEVLRNEPSNEKSDIYSFGVILWELATLRQPWRGMNPMQVVGAVGFQHRRLEIPDDMDFAVARLIRECWQNDPSMRPSFGQLMNGLKLLQKPILVPHSDASRQFRGGNSLFPQQ